MRKKRVQESVVWYKSLAFTIILGFVPLSIIPMLLISYENYKTSAADITKTSYDNLKQASLLDKKFIKNWFHYRQTDIKNWSQTRTNIEFLSKLQETFVEEKSSIESFVKSDTYKDITLSMESDMLRTVKNYDYIYDLFLIDLEGNVLYTVEKESDLGTNLRKGPFSSTKFALAVQKTIDDKKLHFSDLEFYEPSNNTIAGFLTAPMFNASGEMIGVFAIQIKLDIIYDLFHEEKLDHDEFIYYLVGEDGLLRSKIYAESEILKLKVNTQQFNLWRDEHGKNGVHDTDEDETIFSYLDPYERSVFGIHQDINLLGVKWVLIGETNLESVNHLKEEIIQKSLIYLLVMLFIIIVLSILITRYIARPIVSLTGIIKEFASGSRNIKVAIKTENELGILATYFEDMMMKIQKSENALDEQKHALNAHSIVAVTDVTGKITYVNDKFVDISGYLKEELIGQNHKILNSGDNTKEYWADMYKTIAQGKVWHDEIRNVTKTGEYYWVNTTIVPFLDELGKPKSYIAIRTDITDKKVDEIALIQARAIAEESVKAKSEFFASMSHEIRTPMNGVIGMLGLLLNSKLSDAQKHQAYLAQSSAKALLNLINDILDFSKVEAGKVELDITPFNVRDDFGDFAEAISFKAQEKGVAVVLDMKDVDIDIIEADSHRIRQILNNLVSNAIKFTHEGYVLIKVALVKQNDRDARLKITIKDTGIGIPQNKIKTLFDSFSQVDTSTTRKYGGTGLGLAIAKKLSLLMDGDIKVSSQESVGSEFKLDIAVKLSSEASIVTPNVSVKDKKVLILDQCSVSTDTLCAQLKHWGMKVATSLDKSVVYDIIFISKDKNALRLAQELKVHYPRARFILMTSLAEAANISEYMESVYDSHFPQPATTKDILNALKVLSLEYKVETLSVVQERKNSDSFSKDIRILLVDDNKVNQLVANGILEEMGLEADVANNGLEALKALEEAGDKAYDIVLMDCQMPKMDGYEATRIIKSGEMGDEIEKTPVIAMTANAMDGDKEKCFAAGMDDYISKPIDPDKLEAVLRQYLT